MSKPTVRAVVASVLPGYTGNTFSMAALKELAESDSRLRFDPVRGEVYIELEVEVEMVQRLLQLKGATIDVPA